MAACDIVACDELSLGTNCRLGRIVVQPSVTEEKTTQRKSSHQRKLFANNSEVHQNGSQNLKHCPQKPTKFSGSFGFNFLDVPLKIRQIVKESLKILENLVTQHERFKHEIFIKQLPKT